MGGGDFKWQRRKLRRVLRKVARAEKKAAKPPKMKNPLDLHPVGIVFHLSRKT